MGDIGVLRGLKVFFYNISFISTEEEFITDNEGNIFIGFGAFVINIWICILYKFFGVS